MTATAAGERVGFEARDSRLVEPCAESLTRRRRAKEDRYGGFEEHVDCCQAGGNGNLHGDRMDKLAGWRKGPFVGTSALGGWPPGGLSGQG